MIEGCRKCGQDVDIRPTAKGTRMAISLEREPGGTIELRESRAVVGAIVAVRVAAERNVPRYVEHAKVCRGKKRGR